MQPSIVPVRRTPVWPFATLALVFALTFASSASASPVMTLRDGGGGAFVREDRYLPRDELPAAGATATAAAPARPLARAAADGASRRTVRGELARMLAAGAIDQAAHDLRRQTYVDALKMRRRLAGARRAALGAVLRNLEDVAASGGLTASRLPALFETVARNREWWSRGPLLRNGARVSFAGSSLVWQHYTGQGLQIQWLGTFGKANGLWQAQTHDAALRKLLDEALGLAAERAGGIAFEYLFRFDGGRPPWVSGLAQGTAVQALSRAAVRLNEPRFFASARSGLGVFREGPPGGVRVATDAGAHYLIYSFAPGLRVLNAFTQALNGLNDFAVLANDAEGRELFEAGDRQLRVELQSYDTGAWSRYSNQRESDLSYHKLSRDFLRNLCTRLVALKERTAVAPAPGEPGTPVPATPAGGAPTLAPPSGGAVSVPAPDPPAALAPGPAGPPPVADPQPYCETAQRFTRYLTTAPVLRLVSRRARAGHAVSVRLALSKPAFVSAAFQRDGRTVAVLRGRFASGVRALRWTRPRASGRYTVILRATDLAGNDGSAKGTLRVLKAKKRRKR